jgi:hypothetical protein
MLSGRMEAITVPPLCAVTMNDGVVRMHRCDECACTVIVVQHRTRACEVDGAR